MRVKRMVMPVVAALALPSVSAAAPVQWTVGDGGNGHWYEAVLVGQAGITWSDANDEAMARGWYLATITSAQENAFVHGLVDHDSAFWHVLGTTTSGPWLGAFQPPGSPEPAGNWTWVTGEEWDYTNWDQSQPNNWEGRDESVMQFYGHNHPAPPTWNDITDPPPAGYEVYGYIIEIPEPATLALLALGGLALIGGKRVPVKIVADGGHGDTRRAKAASPCCFACASQPSAAALQGAATP